MCEKVRVSVPIYAIGSRLDFHFPTGVAVIRLPFQALGNDAEAIRQHAFRVIADCEGATRWTCSPHGRQFEGEVELEPAEIRFIMELADRLATHACMAA